MYTFCEYQLSPDLWGQLVYVRACLELELVKFELHQVDRLYFPQDFANSRYYKEGDIMPRAKKDTKGNEKKYVAKRTGNTKWVNVKLDDVDLVEIERGLSSRLEIFNDFAALQTAGGDIGVKWVDDGQSVMAYAIVDDAAIESQRCGLSAYAGDAFDAIAALCYKYYHKLGGSVTAGDEANKPRFG